MLNMVGHNNFALYGRFYNQSTPYSTYANGAPRRTYDPLGFNNCVYGEREYSKQKILSVDLMLAQQQLLFQTNINFQPINLFCYICIMCFWYA